MVGRSIKLPFTTRVTLYLGTLECPILIVSITVFYQNWLKVQTLTACNFAAVNFKIYDVFCLKYEKFHSIFFKQFQMENCFRVCHLNMIENI